MLDFTWEPYGDGYIITYRAGGCHPSSIAETALIREVERFRALGWEVGAHPTLIDPPRRRVIGRIDDAS